VAACASAALGSGAEAAGGRGRDRIAKAAHGSEFSRGDRRRAVTPAPGFTLKWRGIGGG
jgi:hypothetical protein